MRLQFGEWTPDVTPLASAVVEAKNVTPYVDGYRPLRDVSAKTGALASACVGAAWFTDEANVPQTFAGTAAKLYKRSGDAWSDVSLAGGYTGARWEFVKWGDWCIATNGVEYPQYIDMSSGANFANLSTAVKGYHMAVIRDFVVFGETTESATAYPSRVRWSGFNNAQSYGSSLATQADYQDLLGNGGRIQRIVSGDVGVIFQERSIWTMEYVGPATIFRFSEVEPGRGTPSPDSVCWMGSQIYYFSHDGFMAFSLGGGSQPIGAAKIDQWFKNEVDTTRLDEIRGVVDRENRLVYWTFPSASEGSASDSMVIYHTPSGRWSYARVTTEIIFEGVGVGYNLDTLDSILTDIDAEPIAVDSRAYLGGATLLSAFDSSHKMATFDGDYLAAEVSTGEMGEDVRLFITTLRPLVDGGSTVTVQIGSRNTQSENVNWSPVLPVNSTGQITTRRNSRYNRFKVMVSGGFTRLFGLDINPPQEGAR